MFSFKIILVLLLPMLVLKLQAQDTKGVVVSATVDRNQVGVGDVVNLTISISAQESVSVDNPGLPDIPGFELINSSTGSETRSSFTNGRFVTQQARTFTYMMAVLKPGQVEIPSISVTVDGTPYPTKPITITVSNNRANPNQQARRGNQPDPLGGMFEEEEELFNQILQRNFPGMRQIPQQGPPVNPNEAFFIQAETDKTKAYVGEQVTTSFYLYTRGQIRDIDTLKYPNLKGFWKEELEMATRLNFEQVVVEGIPYQRALLVSYALFPIKAGPAKIDQYKAKCTVLTPTNFGFGRPYQFTKASREISIDVSEIPVEGRPPNFTGAVGRFRLSANFEPTTGATNQPVTLRVRFEGQGNAKLIELPKLELPPAFELYDQKSQAKYMKDGTSFKEFEVLLIPREPGTFEVPPLSIAVFDPETKKFTTVSSQSLNIAVTGSATATGLPAQATVTPSKDIGPKLPALATDVEVHSSDPIKMGIITAIVYSAAALFLTIFGWRRLRRKPKKVSLTLVLGRRSKKIRNLIAAKEFRRVGVEMTNAAYYILGQVSDQGAANLELSLLLEKTPPSLRNELSAPIENLLNQCEALSFAPEALVGSLSDQSKLESLNSEFERIMNRAIQLAEI
jgi:hypothetical protein